MIDERRSDIPCWLVWALTKSGQTVLRAVDLVEEFAQRHKKALDAEEEMLSNGRNVRVYIEPSLLNHLYCGIMDERAIENARRYARRTGD